MNSDLNLYNHREFLKQTRLAKDFYNCTVTELAQMSKSSALVAIDKQLMVSDRSAMADIVQQQKQLFSGLESINSTNRMMSQIAEQLRMGIDASNRMSQVAEQLRMGIYASIVWDSSITQIGRRLQDICMPLGKTALASRLLEPSRVYAEFAEKTFERIKRNENERVTKALPASVNIVKEQPLMATDALSEIVTIPKDDEVTSPPRELPLLIIQQDESIALTEKSNKEDEVSLIQLSITSQIARSARVVLQLINQCNEVVKVSGQQEIFKPTTRLLEAFTDLPWLASQDRRTFAEFVDDLYFIFYEGAGTDKLRFLVSYGGVLEKANCNFIWCIKHLRNKWLRHDIDHGKEVEIKRSWSSLADQLNWLGLKHAPTTKQHFHNLHQRLLEEAVLFLQNLLRTLIERVGAIA